jgi:hypothetical protein
LKVFTVDLRDEFVVMWAFKFVWRFDGNADNGLIRWQTTLTRSISNKSPAIAISPLAGFSYHRCLIFSELFRMIGYSSTCLSEWLLDFRGSFARLRS